MLEPSSGEIFALYDGEKFIACVYVEKQINPRIMNIHLSIVERIAPEMFIAAAADLRNLLLRRGVTVIRGWILRKNFALARILGGIGFEKTSLSMRFGAVRGIVLRWQMYELRRG